MLAPSAATAPVVSAATALEVPRLRIPDYLDTRDIQVRDADSVLTASRTGRWASRLSDQLTDTLVADLQRLHPELQVTRSDLDATATPRLLVDLDVLEVSRDGTATRAGPMVDHAPRSIRPRHAVAPVAARRCDR